MEETREKLELFGNYYLPDASRGVELLGMYIIVFREGMISQLKDYTSVTSDWISYALIDDTTNDFDPLIQGIEYEADTEGYGSDRHAEKDWNV
ncbi:CorA metal ion transporter [Ceratobasidium sp. 428]|nr:CorA metal ion transporter [Ceratobasidium sp. 428]